MIYKLRISLCFLLLGASFCGTCYAEAADREWTVMVYMNAKNNLERAALSSFASMARVGSSARVAIVAELGRPFKKHYTIEQGGWSGVCRFLIARGTNPLPKEAVDGCTGTRNDDMGKASSLSSFIVWAKNAYPARRYMLVIWSHGQGWRLQLTGDQASDGDPAIPLGGFRAVSSDDDTGSVLYNADVAEAVAGSFANRPLDLIGFDACLMAMIETAYALEPNAGIMVASEELEPAAGWNYAEWLGRLVAKPDATAKDLGTMIVAAYESRWRDDYLTTLSALELKGIRESAAHLSTFANALRAAGSDELSRVAAARADMSSYGDSFRPPTRLSVDLVGLLRRYERRTKNEVLRLQSSALRQRLSGHVFANYASARSAKPPGRDPYGSEGLAIYFPISTGEFQKDSFRSGYLKENTDRPVAFVRNETWAELLHAILRIK